MDRGFNAWGDDPELAIWTIADVLVCTKVTTSQYRGTPWLEVVPGHIWKLNWEAAAPQRGTIRTFHGSEQCC